MRHTLLIADGDADLCDLYQWFLTKRGYEVETSLNGLDCLRSLRRQTPAALVLNLDLLWGGADGILAWLREEHLTHALPVILVAAADCPRDFAELIEAPVVECLLKPFKLTTLLESVRYAKKGDRHLFSRPLTVP